MRSSLKFVLLIFGFALLVPTRIVLGQEESYEEKLRKHREDSLRVVAENQQKELEKELIDKQNEVRIAYNEGLKLMRVRQDERAIQSLRKAVNVDIEGVDDTKAKAYYVEAFCQKRLRRYDAAITAYQNAVKLEPSYTEAYYGLGKTLADVGKVDEAIDVFNQAIAADPNYDKAYYELGRVYLDKKISPQKNGCLRFGDRCLILQRSRKNATMCCIITAISNYRCGSETEVAVAGKAGTVNEEFNRHRRFFENKHFHRYHH